MASWLKKSSNEITLYHTSELPYYIADDHILICNNNLLTEDHLKIDNHIAFCVNRQMVKRQSANYWRLVSFPHKVDKTKIISVFNNSKITQNTDRESLLVVAIKASYANSVSEQNLYDIVEHYDKSFLLYKTAGAISTVPIADESFCCESWHGAILNILDNLCIASTRNENWVRNIPDITLEVYGIEDNEDLDSLHQTLVDFNLLDKIDLSIR